MVYKAAVVLPNGGLVRSFAPPALLRANNQLRNEAIPIFYGQNHFEITIKRSPQDEVRADIGGLPSVDMWVWRRFLYMWDVFNCFGSNCLRHVRHIMLIYQLSMDDGYSFGEGEFDRRLGFRLSSELFEKDSHDSDTSTGQGTQSDPAEPEDEADGVGAEAPQGEDSENEGSEGDESDGEVEQAIEDHSDSVGVFELSRGPVDWRSRRDTHFFLFHRMCEYGNVLYRIKGSPEGARHRLPRGRRPPTLRHLLQSRRYRE